MHLLGRGIGSPTIVFSCGNGMFSYGNFFRPFSELSKDYRVVLYDRFGYGWSERTSRPRTIEQINNDLLILLEKAGEKPPFVLVGHSFGATELFQFAQRNTKLVAGVILLDGGSSAFYRGNRSIVWKSIFSYLGLGFLRTTGIFRLLFKIKPLEGINPGEVERIENMMIYNKSAHWNSFQQVKALPKIKELNNDLGNVPLLILTAEKSNHLDESFQKSQKELLSFSKNSEQKIIKGADHFFPVKNPELVTREIETFIAKMGTEKKVKE